MEDCIFCKIVKKEIPASIVYEDSKYIAFLDITPVNKGHTLVIPKEHHEDLLSTSDSILDGMLNVAKKIAKAVLSAVDSKGCNVFFNVGKVAGQAVPHLHLHITPRFEDDGYSLWHGKEYPEGQMQEVAARIKENL